MKLVSSLVKNIGSKASKSVSDRFKAAIAAAPPGAEVGVCPSATWFAYRNVNKIIPKKDIGMFLKKTNLSLNATSEYDYINQIRFDFLQSIEDVTAGYVTITERYNTNDMSLIEVAEYIETYLARKDFHMKTRGISNEVICLLNVEIPFIVIVDRGIGRSDRRSQAEVGVSVSAPQYIAKMLMDFCDGFEGDGGLRRNTARIHWWYMARNGAQSISISIQDAPKIYPEYYPWFESGPEKYFENFLNSESPILLISGAPGTGKTTFLRAMICKHELQSHIGYDMKLFENDGMFIDFIAGPGELMILEDAENLMLPRKKNDSSMMARFLNVSDGLIRFPRKKFIFTTNDADFSNVDPALIRPGRCYDSVEFRSLNYNETVEACKRAALEVPKKRQDYSLAEIFNQHNRLVKLPRIGFVA